MTTTTFEKGDKARRIEKRLSDPVAVLKGIGAVMVSESQRAFREQKFGATTWRARGSVNTMGIIADFHAGRRKPPARRFETRPALRDTGALGRSIAAKVSGNAVTVGSNLAYSGVHQSGGAVESKPITADVQSRMRSWLRSQPEGIVKSLRFLTRPEMEGQRLQGRVPARPFVGITKWTRRAIRKTIGVELLEVR